MYDTITFWKPEKVPLDSIANLLSNPEVKKRLKSGIHKVTGRLKNLEVTASENSGVYIKGSLAKWHYGNNLESVTRKETQIAIGNLSDTLHLNLSEARVYRFDVGATFTVKHPISEYLSCLGESRFFKRSTLTGLGEDSLYYINKRRALCLYDKVEECRLKKQPLPDVFLKKNLLRYELRFKNRVKAQFKDTILARQLYQEDFYIKALDIWKAQYFAINRLHRLKMKDSVNIEGVKGLVNQLALIGLQQLGGEAALLEMVQQSRQSGQLAKMQAQRLKKKIKNLASTPEAIEENHCLEELDEKVKRQVRHYR